VVNLTGTGVAASAYEVNLQWDAPTSSTDPVAGYNVYRAPSGSTSYELLNASPVTKTAYTDNNVTDGQTYDYVVESVDAEGNTSAPSNMASVSVP
jgi:fibronectin type 3 domain-containing protein